MVWQYMATVPEGVHDFVRGKMCFSIYFDMPLWKRPDADVDCLGHPSSYTAFKLRRRAMDKDWDVVFEPPESPKRILISRNISPSRGKIYPRTDMGAARFGEYEAMADYAVKRFLQIATEVECLPETFADDIPGKLVSIISRQRRMTEGVDWGNFQDCISRYFCGVFCSAVRQHRGNADAGTEISAGQKRSLIQTVGPLNVDF